MWSLYEEYCSSRTGGESHSTQGVWITKCWTNIQKPHPSIQVCKGGGTLVDNLNDFLRGTQRAGQWGAWTERDIKIIKDWKLVAVEPSVDSYFFTLNNSTVQVQFCGQHSRYSTSSSSSGKLWLRAESSESVL